MSIASERSSSTRWTASGRHMAVLLVACCLLLPMNPTGRLAVSSRHPARRPIFPSVTVAGPLTAIGSPYLRDHYGRVVIFHGVNTVYKLAPYELYPDPGEPWDFSVVDAAQMAALGFDAVRLGIFWAGLEPGTLGPNNPAICTVGKPTDPDLFARSVAAAYLARVKQTVDLLGSYGIFTILDMHQDLYSSVFGGDGAPPWAVCTNGNPIVRAPGRWSNTYHTAAVAAAFEHFWNNDVVGDLQGEYDRVWAYVASYFRDNPWIIGYDPFNEPYSTSVLDVGHHELDAQIECFYTGTSHPGAALGTGRPLSCPPTDPAKGLIESIKAADPTHPIFYEPDIFSAHGAPNYIGAMDFPNLVLNFHAYCPYRDPTTGDPTDPAACAAWTIRSMTDRYDERALLASPKQTSGPPIFMSEFGATNDVALLNQITAEANRYLLGWTYWAWKFYDDPTGSSDEGLVGPTGQLQPGAQALAQTYPQAIAGTPTSVSFDPTTRQFELRYVPDDRIRAPTTVFVPVRFLYPNGYCATVDGGRIVSAPGTSLLEVENASRRPGVSITVQSGSCQQPQSRLASRRLTNAVGQ